MWQASFRNRTFSTHSATESKKLVVKPLRDLNASVWSTELEFDTDKEFLLQGIISGFDIVTEDNIPSGISAKNHPSVSLNSPLYSKAHAQVLAEIECGNYVFADCEPKIISPMAALSKPDGGIRLIHDCSRPAGSAVNDFVSNLDKHKFQTVDDAVKLVTKNCYMAKVDLKSAYRSVRLSSKSQQVTGFKWTFPDGREHVLLDKKLPFGSKLAPGIFHRLSQAVRRMMSRRGFQIVAYIDDFFICESSKQKCQTALNTLISLLRQLGFLINWSKVVDPTQKLTFLGIEIDSKDMELRLSDDKLANLQAELAAFSERKRASKKQLQSLAGKLNWASAVVRGGRVFLRRIIDGIAALKKDWHKAKLIGEIKRDILWWRDFISTFNGKAMILDHIPITSVFTDACKTGGGGVYNQDWFYANWQADYPFVAHLHINEIEAFSVVLASLRWAHLWQNKQVIIYSDNMATVHCINKCTSRNKLLMSYLRQLFWKSAKYNFHLKALHVEGRRNILADCISRLHETRSFITFLHGCLPQPLYVQHLHPHMSHKSLQFLLKMHAT